MEATSDYIMMGKLLLPLSYKESITGTETDLLLQAVVKITFITIVAVMWWNSVGILVWKPLMPFFVEVISRGCVIFVLSLINRKDLRFS